MRGGGLLVALGLAACAAPAPREPVRAQISPDLPEVCTRHVSLPAPPKPERSFAQVLAWAKLAGETALAAIHERDLCAEAYARLRTEADRPIPGATLQARNPSPE